MHQRQVAADKPKRVWRKALVEEMQPKLAETSQCTDFWKLPDLNELQQWATLGMLPPGKGGRPTTTREQKQWQVRNVCRDISQLEKSIKDNVQYWKADFDWTPRPLSCGSKFFLVFFSGHRRWGDISSWFHWQGDITPIAVDLAVSEQHGDMMQHGLWQGLIRARRVVGAHGGPPCETYSSARWIELPDQQGPRPLRDCEMPWGRDYLMLHELQQCVVGSTLMMVTLKLLLLVYVHGGSASLEHPKGNPESEKKWCIWMSSLIHWILQGPDWRTLTFLQGPLGQCAPKPTTMLLARMVGFDAKIFGQYNMKWRPSFYLGGRDEQGWRTARAKVYPWRLSWAIAESHKEHARTLTSSGNELIDEDVLIAIQALSQIFDPYDPTAANHIMQADYHRRRHTSTAE